MLEGTLLNGQEHNESIQETIEPIASLEDALMLIVKMVIIKTQEGFRLVKRNFNENSYCISNKREKTLHLEEFKEHSINGPERNFDLGVEHREKESKRVTNKLIEIDFGEELKKENNYASKVALEDEESKAEEYINNIDQLNPFIQMSFKIPGFIKSRTREIEERAKKAQVAYETLDNVIEIAGSQQKVFDFLTWLYDLAATSMISGFNSAFELSQDFVQEEISVSTFHRTHKQEILTKSQELNIVSNFGYDIILSTGYVQSLEEFKTYLYELETQAKRSLYPRYWNFHETNIYSKIDVPKHSKEFEEISSIVCGTLPGAKIVKLIRIQNNYLMNHYVTNINMRQELRPGRINRRLLFHGTSSVDPKKIYENFDTGFDLQYAKISGLYGKGLYFAEYASYSHQRFSFKLKNGNWQILLADVFLGKSYRCGPSLGLLKAPEGYDSIDSGNNFYVIYNNFHSYPLYLIEYRLEGQGYFEKANNIKFIEQTSTVKLSPSAHRRILTELKALQAEKGLNHFSIKILDETDPSKWIISVQGPVDPPYEGGRFVIRLSFPAGYPLDPPSINFQTRIYHPCVDPYGKICLGLLSQWNPGIDIRQILLTINALFYDPLMEEPLVLDIAQYYLTDKLEFTSTARSWTQKYAK